MQTIVDLYHAFNTGDFFKIDSFVLVHGVNWRTDGDYWNLLHLALLSVSRAPNPTVIKHLIGLGVDVNAKDDRRWTPLHFAARTKNSEAVKLLIEVGADVNARDDEGITPLHRGLFTYPVNLEMTEMLLAAGAQITDVLRRYANVVAWPDSGALFQLMAKYDKICFNAEDKIG